MISPTLFLTAGHCTEGATSVEVWFDPDMQTDSAAKGYPFTGEATCPAAETYRRELGERQEREVQTLANLTGWDVATIRERAGLGSAPISGDPWWRRIFD